MVRITPTNPTASQGGAVTLTKQVAGIGQWRLNGVDLPGETSSMLKLTNIQASQAGRYSVVVTNASQEVSTNFVYLTVDTSFSKITTGPLVTDQGCTVNSVWSDYNGDGFEDVFVARFTTGKSTLYRNLGNGTFAAVPNVLPSSLNGWGALWADFDNDGRPDLFFAGSNKPAYFFFNNGNGTFIDSQFLSSDPGCVSVIDYNLDGRLDLYLSTQTGTRNLLYGNQDGRTFISLTTNEVGDLVKIKTFGGLAWGDYDDDGRSEVFVANHPSQSRIFRNDGTGRFVEVTNAITRDASTIPLVGAWGDYDNDGRLDLFAACWSSVNAFYRNVGQGEFERASFPQTRTNQCNSATWADYDNDGFLDLSIPLTRIDPGLLR